LAGGGDVGVVTVNYRLGALGFLDLSSFDAARRRFDSNIGLHDVLAALGWVRDNIAAFGGDPHKVTLFGESAGAGIATTLLAVSAAEGLFAGTIAESSPATSVYDRARAQRVAVSFLDKLGIAPSDTGSLAHVPIAAILATSQEVFDEVPVRNPGTLAFVPIVDGDLLHDYPVKLAREGRSHPVVRLLDPVPEAASDQRGPRHRIALCVGQSRGTQGSHVEAGRCEDRQGGVEEGAGQVDQLRRARKARGPGRRARTGRPTGRTTAPA
jgi:para-nitrobenzyl esterase